MTLIHMLRGFLYWNFTRSIQINANDAALADYEFRVAVLRKALENLKVGPGYAQCVAEIEAECAALAIEMNALQAQIDAVKEQDRRYGVRAI